MNSSNLDNRVHGLLIIGMLAMFCSVAFEAARNGMADPVVAVREAPATVIAVASTGTEAPTLVAQNSSHQPR
jgi:hypothetical protein